MKMKFKLNVLVAFSALSILSISEIKAQDSLSMRMSALEERLDKYASANTFKLSGYIQTQFQIGQQDAGLKIGAPNLNNESNYSRFGIRRGRVKVEREQGIAKGVFQIDLTEKGLAIKDAYMSIEDPWIGRSEIKAGVFNRPFGYEIGYSSSNRESPERSMLMQTLFPEERDVGAMVTLQANDTSPLHFLKLEAGLFGGNGIKIDTDSRKDFIGHLSLSQKVYERIKLGGGFSYYNGGVYQGTQSIYKMEGTSMVPQIDPKFVGRYAKREYMGLDFQFQFTAASQITKIMAEYITGTQPGTAMSTKSPNYSSLPTSDTYIRNFDGGYIGIAQDVSKLPLVAVLKYEWYDPNTKVSSDEIGLNGTGKADLGYHTYGMGLLFYLNESVRIHTYYDFVNNERSANLSGYENNIRDNVFTLRLQYKF